MKKPRPYITPWSNTLDIWEHSRHVETLACVIYISLTFYNSCCVLLQCNTQLRVLYLLKKNLKKGSHSTLLLVGKSLSVRQNKYQSQSNDFNKTILGDLGTVREKTLYFHWYPDFLLVNLISVPKNCWQVSEGKVR